MGSEESKGLRDPMDLASELQEVVALVEHPDQVEEFLARALELLGEAIPHDLATFLQRRGDRLRVRLARGARAVDALGNHQVEVGVHPELRRLLDQGRPRLVESDDGIELSSSLFQGLLDLPAGHSALLLPVAAAGRDLGLLTFHSWKPHAYSQSTLRAAVLAGQLLGLGVAAAEQARQLEVYRQSLEERNRLLAEEAEGDEDACLLLEESVSKAMRRLVQMAKQVAITDAPVLITGETGTGKDVFARAIHGWSLRSDKPFIHLNCAALPAELIESELFGHARGAFSGAVRERPGRFRLADGGTLLLDEVGDLPPDVQVKLLRVLQEGTFEPVGYDRTVSADVRVIAATNVDLERAMEEQEFREDLFYRLNVFPMHVPPLRDRPEDLPVLTRRILERLHRQTGRGPWTIRESSWSSLQRYSWPGNVRELVNAIERAGVLAPAGGEISLDLPTSRRSTRSAAREGWPKLDDHQREYIERVLQRTGGKIYGPDGAARILGLPPTTLQSRMRKLGISRKKKA